MDAFWSTVFKLFVFLSLGASVLIMGWPWFPLRWLYQVFLPFFQRSRHHRQEGTTETVAAGPALEEAVYSDPQQYCDQSQGQEPPDLLAAAFVESQLQLAAEARASQQQASSPPPTSTRREPILEEAVKALRHGIELYGALPDKPAGATVSKSKDDEDEKYYDEDRPYILQVVTVNGERVMTPRTRVSYYTVVHWAFPGFTPEEIMDMNFVVTYRFGPPQQRNGSLRPGESVPLLSGMSFFCMGKQHYSV